MITPQQISQLNTTFSGRLVVRGQVVKMHECSYYCPALCPKALSQEVLHRSGVYEEFELPLAASWKEQALASPAADAHFYSTTATAAASAVLALRQHLLFIRQIHLIAGDDAVALQQGLIGADSRPDDEYIACEINPAYSFQWQWDEPTHQFQLGMALSQLEAAAAFWDSRENSEGESEGRVGVMNEPARASALSPSPLQEPVPSHLGPTGAGAGRWLVSQLRPGMYVRFGFGNDPANALACFNAKSYFRLATPAESGLVLPELARRKLQLPPHPQVARNRPAPTPSVMAASV